MSITPQAYRMICRTGLLCWLNPSAAEVLQDEVAALESATLFLNHLLSLFDSYTPVSGLTEQDFNTFVREDILDEYGAEAFLSRCTRLLTDARGTVNTDGQFDSLVGSLKNLARVIKHPEFRQRYASSGFVRALCRLLDNPRLQQYDDNTRWGLHRGALVVIE